VDLIRAMSACCRAGIGLAAMGAFATAIDVEPSRAQDMPNACPVDGCAIKIIGVKKSGSELELTLESNFTPDMSKNHIHVWWGENYKIEQVSNNAETVHHVKQGDWHPMADYPTYITQSAVSTTARGDAKTICVSPADRNHDILDVKVLHCVDVSSQL
jgi:hypothetical protein